VVIGVFKMTSRGSLCTISLPRGRLERPHDHAA
jgi:hypothetical protein